jgi:hypothetical protein
MQALANQYMRSWYKKNSAKVKARTLKYQQANPDKVKAWQRKSKYGITQEQYDGMLQKQDNKCAICKTTEPKGCGSWHIDHNHSTGQVRGLLCNNCNVGIGSLGDDPTRLTEAAKYLSAF